MRIILHAGLHKSGTTSLQTGWNAAYADHPDVWYPRRGHGGPPGHHYLVRPLLSAFTERRDTDLVAAGLAWSLRAGGGPTLADVVIEARARGTGALLVSGEDLDRAVAADVPAIEAAVGGADVTVVVTATRPVHRLCSGWQTLVKHGLAAYPADVGHRLLDFAALRPGRLRELMDLFPASRRVVRLVRTSPREEALATDLASALGLPDAERANGHGTRNVSLGTETEVVLRINRADLALGTSRGGLALLHELRGDGFTYRDVPGLAERYALPASWAEGARAEQEWLRAAHGAVEVLDPHCLLDGWGDATVPKWYAEISGREAAVPALDEALAAEDRETQLWRVRQERAAYQRRLERVQATR